MHALAELAERLALDLPDALARQPEAFADLFESFRLFIVQSEAHWPTAQRLEDEGAGTCLGWHESVSAQTIRLAVQNLLGDPFERQAMARCGRQLIDGRGPDRLVTALEVLLHPSRQIALSQVA